jgi:hypothetical protein
MEKHSTRIRAEQVHPDSIRIRFETCPQNYSKTSGNYVAVWQSEHAAVPWNAEPVKIIPVANDKPEGTIAIQGLNTGKNNYLVGYAAGPVLTHGNAQRYGNVCATVFVPAGSAGGEQFSSSLQNVYFTSNAVLVHYELPEGIQPKSNGAWIGIYRSSDVHGLPHASEPIPGDASHGSVAIHFPVLRAHVYTVALFTSGFEEMKKGQASGRIAAVCSGRHG